MKQFTYKKAKDVATALAEAPKAHFVAGGTTLLDLMKLNVETPDILVDINRLPLDKIEVSSEGVKIGALVRNSDLANHPFIKGNFAVLSEALLAGASPQLRNMATTGGNLLQRTRCMYFRDTTFACNKRQPGSGCAAIDGDNRTLAILGTSDHCIATNPSDMNVALTALEAVIHIEGKNGQSKVAINDFYLLPGDTPHLETELKPGELITHVSLKTIPAGSRSTYLKLRDRASYEFALASAAIITNVEGGKITHARIALGGVGTKPWRCLEAEKVLKGAAPTKDNFVKAADAVLREAKPQTRNKFKIELSRRCLVHALKIATDTA